MSGDTLLAPTVIEHRGRVMGTDLHLVAVGTEDAAAGAVARAVARLALLEARWSRFRPTSELSRAASAAGTWVDVSDDTVRLVTAGLEAWERTGGRCDLTGGVAIAAAGYDRDLAERRALGPARPASPVPFPGPDSIELDALRGRLRLRSGTVLDAGAVGKGLAADLIVEELLHPIRGVAGLEGLLVNVGGDLRAGRQLKVVAHRRQHRRQPVPTQHRRRAAADEDGVDRPWADLAGRQFQLDPHGGQPAVGIGAPELGRCVGVEVAVTAAGGAERHMDVDAEGAVTAHARNHPRRLLLTPIANLARLGLVGASVAEWRP